jgi:prolipoprotein diacylglyceryl transferase
MHLFIPTPGNSKMELGFLTLHYYALFILLGIFVAIYLTQKRYVASGGERSEISDLALYLIPTGIIGGRIYHVITSPDNYFGKGGHPLDAVKIWQGGMGIWGAVSLGVLTAFIYFKIKSRVGTFKMFADCVAPALLIAQGIGRFGNWFNGELFGSPTTLPWGLEIPIDKRPLGYENFLTFHPTFLYEALWCFICAVILMKSKRMNSMKPGELFIAYIAFYCLGRLWIEMLRIDSAHLILGIRLNVWVAFIGLTLSSAYFLRRSLSRERINPN